MFWSRRTVQTSIYSYFKLTTAVPPQRQVLLKRVPTAKITSPQRPVKDDDQYLMYGVYKTLIRTAFLWSTFDSAWFEFY